MCRSDLTNRVNFDAVCPLAVEELAEDLTEMKEEMQELKAQLQGS